MADSPISTPQQLPESRKSQTSAIYSNSVNLDITPWEFKFTFGRLQKVEKENRMIVEQLIEITASPQLAKALLNILTLHMQEYERTVGEVKVPPPVAAPKP